jgi:hypothetical protein
LPALTTGFTKAKVLIGEGREDVYFFEALCDHLHITDVQVEEYWPWNAAAFQALLQFVQGL